MEQKPGPGRQILNEKYKKRRMCMKKVALTAAALFLTAVFAFAYPVLHTNSGFKDKNFYKAAVTQSYRLHQFQIKVNGASEKCEKAGQTQSDGTAELKNAVRCIQDGSTDISKEPPPDHIFSCFSGKICAYLPVKGFSTIFILKSRK
jgi:hypothetical protein